MSAAFRRARMSRAADAASGPLGEQPAPPGQAGQAGQAGQVGRVGRDRPTGQSRQGEGGGRRWRVPGGVAPGQSGAPATTPLPPLGMIVRTTLARRRLRLRCGPGERVRLALPAAMLPYTPSRSGARPPRSRRAGRVSLVVTTERLVILHPRWSRRSEVAIPLGAALIGSEAAGRGRLLLLAEQGRSGAPVVLALGTAEFALTAGLLGRALGIGPLPTGQPPDFPGRAPVAS